MDDDRTRDTSSRPIALAGAPTEEGTAPRDSAPAVDAFLPTQLNETRAGSDPGGAPIVLPAAGYQLKELIGRGGMGEVVAAHDRRIGRHVALKRVRGQPSTGALARFLREARIQARLDHPAIVPVYELGIDPEGNPYFTMKRIGGVTLAQCLTDPGVSLQSLLRTFVDICLAVEFAHARGVVHRDLKPSNIILGEYGETYVLDWGIARVIASERAELGGDSDLPAYDDVETAHGSLLGTPGYMSPEQCHDAATVTAASDVYALGAILFEILAGEPLHPRGVGAIASTLESNVCRPSERRPERAVPPELDAACGEALIDDPERRPTARELADRVQRYLDGDRDIEQRRTLAAEQLAKARAAIESGDPARRADAIHAAGRALALHPESVEAAELVTRLIVEPPREHPPELEAQLVRSEAERAKSRARNGMIGFTMLLALTSAIAFLEVKHWPSMVALWVAIALNFALGIVTIRIGLNRTRYVAVTTTLVAVAFARMASPFLFVPTLICGAALSVASTPWMTQRLVRPVAWVIVIALLPFVLEWTGVLTSTVTAEPGRLIISSAVFQTRGAPDYPAIVLAHVGLLVTIITFIHGVVRDRRRAEREVEIQAWHLRKLLPTQAQPPGHG